MSPLKGIIIISIVGGGVWIISSKGLEFKNNLITKWGNAQLNGIAYSSALICKFHIAYAVIGSFFSSRTKKFARILIQVEVSLSEDQILLIFKTIILLIF